MKKILASLALTIFLTSGIWSSAHAVTRWSYNPTSFSLIRVIGQWGIGNQRIALATHSFCLNGQGQFAVTEVWLNHFTGQITVNVTTAPTGHPCP